MLIELVKTPAPFFLPHVWPRRMQKPEALAGSCPPLQLALVEAKSMVSLISAFHQRVISHTFFFLSFFLETSGSKHVSCTHSLPHHYLSISQTLCSSGYDCICQPQNRSLPYLIKDESFLSGTSKLA